MPNIITHSQITISNVNDGETAYVHIAWADSSDGKLNFTLTESETRKYQGTYSDHIEKPSTDPSVYNWVELNGAVERENRNLLIGTRKLDGTEIDVSNATLLNEKYKNARIARVVNYGGIKHYSGYLRNRGALEPDTYYTYSMMIKYIKKSLASEAPVFKVNCPSEFSPSGLNISTIREDMGWVKMSFTFKTNSTLTTTTSAIWITSDNLATLGGVTHQACFKLEKGKVATDWSEAPEDLSDTVDFLPNYIQSRLENLVTNGTGFLGNNYNFSRFVFDGNDRVVGKGSFKKTGNSEASSLFLDEYISVNTKNPYLLEFYTKNLSGSNKFYSAIAQYDVDGNAISPQNVGGDLTTYKYNNIYTLAKPLNKGDTKVYLNTVEGLTKATISTALHQNSLIFWGYKNSYGYTYPDKTYSRYVINSAYDATGVNESENSITLKSPFSVENKETSDGSFPIGHKLSNTQSGSSYYYPKSLTNIAHPGVWTKYSTVIFGDKQTAVDATATIKLGFLFNRDKEDTSFVNGLSLSDYSGYDTINKVVDGLNTNLNAVTNNLDSLSKKVSISLALKVGYSNWTTVNDNCLYVTGLSSSLSSLEETATDTDGFIRNWETNQKIVVPKQVVNITGATQTQGYLVYDATDKLIWFVYYNNLGVWKKYNSGKTNSNTTMVFTNNSYVIGELDLS